MTAYRHASISARRKLMLSLLENESDIVDYDGKLQKVKNMARSYLDKLCAAEY